MQNKIVEFLRRKDFVLEKELGSGACGKTVLLYDSTIDERFACKKYAPARADLGSGLFDAFMREIKLLHLINHRNVVRVFNYYLFPEKPAGYILMEYIQGLDIWTALLTGPQNVNEVFQQTIEGFAHLEEMGILHRDIREGNILVNTNGVVKIIDFGFGKKAVTRPDYDKSVSLNWWCDLPAEFRSSIYDFTTEVYFVGKLFEKIITDLNLEEFKHASLLEQMCRYEPANRIKSFSDVRTALFATDYESVDFTYSERETYQEFSSALANALVNIDHSAKYNNDASALQGKLEEIYKRVMLEEYLPSPAVITRCFINGTHTYSTKHKIPVSFVKTFLHLIRAASPEKRNIIMANLLTKLDAVTRVSPNDDDDIPF
ncbi:protein kinase family protein [Cupriavidus plantarum]|uniref:protein kinase family protein n=1 Tax=Cupriavidus plantarum TaxID=942865 RepID=UPI001B09223A|nr:protein kinase family protein [Cupriavidus plantarum]CAG2128014.1 Serine/threonine-protein kinase PknD [Cupriavidus plantarum]SMR66808.1 serine/threonine protein kinase [Cupriavidus plantarum]